MYIIDFFKKDNNVKAYIFLILTALFILGANPFKSETIAPMDILQSRLGWQNTQHLAQNIHPARGDILDAKLPRWIEAKRHIYEGDIPIWNYVTSGGQPLSLMFTESIYTPAFFIFALIKNDAIAFYFSNLINILIGLIGMYLFLKIFFSRSASIFGAVIFMFSGFNTAWFFWPHVNTTIWAPWVFFTVYKYLHSGDYKYLPFITISMTLLNLGGFPMVAVMTYMALFIMVILLVVSFKHTIVEQVRKLFYLLLFSILSLIIALPMLYALIELFSWIGGIGYRHGGGYLPLSDLKLFIIPDMYGHFKVEKTFYVGILPIIFLFISVFVYKKRPSLIAKYGLLLFLFSITITFSLLNPDLIRMIPTLDKNPWSRFSFLIDTSLAIIAAYVLNELINLTKQKWLFLVVFTLIGYQIMDQKNFFHKFNSIVPNASFYPKTKSISYVKENLQPLQYTLADGGYLNAGTLGAYGISEWYSHGFHSPQEKKILNSFIQNPFQTPTSAVFLCSQINLNSNYIDYLNNKFITCSMGTGDSIELWSHKRKWAPSPILHTNELVQNFHIDENQKVDAIHLYMATHGHKHASSDVELTLYNKNKQKIAHSIVLKEQITDYSWARFKFIEPLLLTPGNYFISINMLDKTNAKNLSIWSFTEEKKYPLKANDKKTDLALKMVLIQERDIPKKYNIVQVEPNITILENKNVKGSAYFLKSLSHNQAIIYDNVITKLISNTQIEITYSDESNGWVILPMRHYPGWEVTINGKEGKIEKFIDMLPAIKVSGKSKIVMTYVPTHSKYTYFLSIFSLFIILLTLWKTKGRQET